jgi:hypothetical protein
MVAPSLPGGAASFRLTSQKLTVINDPRPAR